MNILFLRGFNNYFNRVVKKYSTLDDYMSESSSYINLDNINFNPNDGVATELIVGNENQKENSLPLDWENIGTPDYCICYENSTSGTPPVTTSTIISRWFVLESERTRTGQYRLALKRDVLAEHFDQIMTAPCFVEKGFVNDVSSTLLYNKENMTYNQIKQKPETLLKDETGCGWIIGYVSQDGNRYPSADNTYYTSNARLDEVEGSTVDYDDLPTYIKDIINNDFYFDDLYTLDGTDIFDSATYDTYSEFNINSNISTEFEIKCNNPNDQYTGKIAHLNYYNIISKFLFYNNANYQKTFPVMFDRDSYKGTCHQTRKSSSSWGQIFECTIPGYAVYNESTYPVDFNNPDFYGLERVFGCLNNDLFKNIYFTSFNKTYVAVKTLRNIKKYFNEYKYVRRGNRLYRINYNEELISAPNTEYLDIPHNQNIFMDYGTPETLSYIISHRLCRAADNTPMIGPVMVIASNSQIDKVIGTTEVVGHPDPSMIAGDVNIRWKYGKYKKGMIQLTGVDTTEVKTYMSATRQQCYDCNTDLFAIPYADNFTFINDNDEIIMTKQIALQTAMALGLAGNNVYDIQLLPYYPDRTAVATDDYTIDMGFIYNRSVDLSLFTEHVDFEFVLNENDEPIGAYFWSRVSTNSFTINKTIELSDKTNPLRRKISNEIDLYRLCSPNFCGQFEFSLAKSNGEITAFNIDYTYKPYNPYIHVVPNLSGLYGIDFVSINDARGLICGGDFSMTRMTSAWEQYQLNNKNYQEIFDRQIKNMDVNNQIALEQQQFNAIAGSITGGFSGAIGGAVAGSKAGPYGAIAGAAVGLIGGAALSAFGAEKDRDWLERQQRENKSYAIDMYGYKLGNIQAMPYSLAKTSAFTNNNRIWPFVEYYTATPEEETIIDNKIKYDGMTIMAISTLNNFSTSPYDKTFVKGQLIKLDNLNDDFHIADAIYEEVNKGFYVIPRLED